MLIVCRWGRNRSRYLAGYLAAKGYDTDFAGTLDEMDNQIEKEDVLWADVVLTVTGIIRDEVQERFESELNGKVLHSLEVEDWKKDWGDTRPKATVWRRYQREHTYPHLIEQVEKLLPL